MKPRIARCPICWRRVEATLRGNIYAHTDKTGRSPCPGSFQPYEIALSATQPPVRTTG